MSLADAQKTVVQLISAAVLLAAFFIVFDPALGPALIAVAVEVFAVITVFAAKNHTVEDVTKALQALASAVLGVIGLFATVPTSDAEKILSIIALLVPVVLVYLTRNRGYAYSTELTGRT